MSILAIDPGPVQSAYVIIDGYLMPDVHGKVPNHELMGLIYTDRWKPNLTVIEMVASYGMAVGADVFDTCVWIGRFYQSITDHTSSVVELIKRRDVKLHHCLDSRAKDTNIRQALIDRFAPGEPNSGKGTKANPGWFYGFSKDQWQAYALAVYAADKGL